MTNKERIEALQKVISQFSELIREENRHLSIGSNPSKFSELLNKKRALAATYESHVEGIKVDSEFGGDRSPSRGLGDVYKRQGGIGIADSIQREILRLQEAEN